MIKTVLEAQALILGFVIKYHTIILGVLCVVAVALYAYMQKRKSPRYSIVGIGYDIANINNSKTIFWFFDTGDSNRYCFADDLIINDSNVAGSNYVKVLNIESKNGVITSGKVEIYLDPTNKMDFINLQKVLREELSNQ